MNEKEILKAIGNVDEKYIAESDIEKKKSIKTSAKRVFRKPAFRYAAAALAVVVACAIIFPSLGRFNKKEAGDSYNYYDGGYEGFSGNQGAIPNSYTNSDYSKPDGYSSDNSWKEPEYEGATADGVKLHNAKLIYRSYITAYTQYYDEVEKTLLSLVKECGGYVESQTINSAYALKEGSYVFRIPTERYEGFLDGISNNVTVKKISRDVEDVGLQYSETENRLATLRIKLERLQSLLSQATLMSDILEIENEISYTEMDIERYQNTLNKYDSLIDFSTVNLTLSETQRPGSGADEKPGFFKVLADHFADGLRDVLFTIEDILYAAAYNFVGIVIVIVAFVICKKLKVWSKIKVFFKKKDDEI